MIKTILFDKDGTLIDTEKYYLESYLLAAKDFGCPLTREEALGFRSLGMPYNEAYVKKLFGNLVDWKEFYTQSKKYFSQLMEEKSFQERPYAKEALSMLKEKGYRLAIVTATAAHRAVSELSALGLYEFFDEIISAHMVKRGKPAPDVYEFACQKLQVLPQETIAVEDSPNGVISAYLAGCNTVMIPDQSRPDRDLQKYLYAEKETLLDLAKDLCNK